MIGTTTRAFVVLGVIALLGACNPFAAGGDSLTGKEWKWTASTEVSPASQSVNPTPDDFTIEFKSDGTFASQADCNQLAGSYTTGDGGAMTITTGPMTLAACGDDSLDQTFLAQLPATTSYAIGNAQLVLTQDDGGTMTFD